MRRSLGKMFVHHLFDWSNRAGHTIQETIDAFLTDGDIGEKIAARWIQTAKGVMILQMVKDDPECGGVFVFDRQRSQWYLLDFDFPGHRLTPGLFDRAFREHKLFAYVDQPGLLLSQTARKQA